MKRSFREQLFIRSTSKIGLLRMNAESSVSCIAHLKVLQPSRKNRKSSYIKFVIAEVRLSYQRSHLKCIPTLLELNFQVLKEKENFAVACLHAPSINPPLIDVRAPPLVREKRCDSINVKFFIVVTLSYFLIVE